MNKNKVKHSLTGKRAGLILGAALMITMTGCATQGDRVVGWQARTKSFPHLLERYAFLDQDSYTYFPKYEAYYCHRQHAFAYWSQGAWMLRPTFPGVPQEVFLNSPSVEMVFHDAPDNHHADVLVNYPRTWTEVFVVSGALPSQPVKMD